MCRSRLSLRIVSIILLCAFYITSFTACYDAKEVDDWALVYAIGVDKGVTDLLRFTILFSTLKQGNVGSANTKGATGNDYDSISIDCPTAYAGLNMINCSLSRSVNYSQAKYMVISEELAKKGVETFINGMVRTRQVRRTMYIIVARGQASEFIKSYNPVIGTATSKTQESMMQMEKVNGLLDAVTYFNFLDSMKSYSRMATSTLAALNDFSHYETSGSGPIGFKAPGDYYAGKLPREGGNKQEFLGLVIFNGDKMVGELNGEETRAKLMITGEYNRGSIVIPDPKNSDLRVAIDTMAQKKPNIKVKFQDGKPVISVKVFLEGNLVNLQSDFNYEKGYLKKELEGKYSEYIKKTLDKTIDKCKKLNTDIFAFGEVAAMHFSTIQKFEAYDWLSHFKDAKVTTEVNFVIRRTGTLLKINKTIGSEGDKE